MKAKPKLLFFTLFTSVIILFVINVFTGSVNIPFDSIVKALFTNEEIKPSWNYIIINYRLPKAITAILTGIGLGISGLLMQTYFRNPLAGPYVLGLSSGASLGVAILILGSSLLPTLLQEILASSYGTIAAACMGSLAVFLLIILTSQRLKNTASILIVGLMFGSFSGAIIGALSYFSTAQELQKFTYWSLGNIGNMTWESVSVLSFIVLLGIIISLFSVKSLDALLLGENYAKSMGVNLKTSKYFILIASSLLTGAITAFAGPIAFIGIAVPHIAKLLFQTNQHRILFFATIVIGAILMLFCDILTIIPGTQIMLPINVITSIIGAPVVIYLLVKKRNIWN